MPANHSGGYFIKGVKIQNFTTGNREAKREIIVVKDFMVENVKKRMPLLDAWKVFGRIMNPEN